MSKPKIKQIKPKNVLGEHFGEILSAVHAAVNLAHVAISYIDREDGPFAVEDILPIVLAAMNVISNKEYYLKGMSGLDGVPKDQKYVFCAKLEALRALKYWTGEATMEQLQSKDVLHHLYKEASPETLDLILKVFSVAQTLQKESESLPTEEGH